MKLEDLWQRGIRVLLHDGKLRLQSKGSISPALQEQVRQSKPELMAEMLQPPPVAPHEPRCCTCQSWAPDMPMGRCSEHGFDAEHDDNCRHHSDWGQDTA